MRKGSSMRRSRIKDAAILETDPDMPKVARCECGASPHEFQFGMYFAVACPECDREQVSCSTRVGAIGKWNRSIRTLRAIR